MLQSPFFKVVAYKEATCMEKRKDNKGRILRDGEYQKSDGRYEFRYLNHNSELQSVYSWRLVETDKAPPGKRKTDSLREMEKAIKRNLEDGIIVQKHMTLNKLWDDYIAQKRELKQSTLTNYKYMYRKYVRDVIGDMNISSIKYSTMKKFFNELIRDKGFKPNSVEILHTILHPVFTLAVRDGYIRTNPTAGIMAELKKSHDWSKPKRHALTEAQQAAFINYVASHSTYNHWLPLFTALLGTGCRVGEMLGLRWQDINWEDGIISINHTLIYRVQDSGHCEFHVTTPKTRNGIREIPMFDEVRKALMKVRMKQMEDGFCQDVVDGYSGFIWTNRFGNVENPHCCNRAIERIIRDYNKEETEKAKAEKREALLLPHFSAHTLRHTFCTRLCENESDLKLIQEIMGHADITTTMDIYNESNTDRKKASFARLEGIIKIS